MQKIQLKIENNKLDKDTKNYIQTEQFKKDKENFEQSLENIESGKTSYCLMKKFGNK